MSENTTTLTSPGNLTLSQHLKFLEGPDDDGNEERIDCPAYADALAEAGQPDDARYIRMLGQFTNFVGGNLFWRSEEVRVLIDKLSADCLSTRVYFIKTIWGEACACALGIDCLDGGKPEDKVEWSKAQFNPLTKALYEGYPERYFSVTTEGSADLTLRFDLKFLPAIKCFLTQLIANKKHLDEKSVAQDTTNSDQPT